MVYVEFVMCWLLLIKWWSGVHFDQWLLLQRPIRSIGRPPSFLSIMSLKGSSKSYPGKFCLIMHTDVVGWLNIDYLRYREAIYWKYGCVTRAPLLYFIKSWVALSFKVVSEWVSQASVTSIPDLHFVQYIRACMSSTDPVSSITNCYRLIVSYTDPVHSFIIS